MDVTCYPFQLTINACVSQIGNLTCSVFRVYNFPNWEICVAMRLLGRQNLQLLLCSDDFIRKWVLSWVSELTYANWREPSDVVNQFPKVRLSESGHFVFPINNSNKEVCIQIAFQQGVAVIIGVQ